MTIKTIITEPNKILRQVSKPVTLVGDEERALMDDMLETMYNANGIGLAATQIEDERRLIVIDCGKKSDISIKKENEEFNPNPIKMINPELVFSNQELTEREEGCLSIPGYYGKVKRPNVVKVSYIDENNIKKILKADGLLATCIQHEIDHLNGILFIDHLSKLKREMILKKATKDYKNNNRN